MPVLPTEVHGTRVPRGMRLDSAAGHYLNFSSRTGLVRSIEGHYAVVDGCLSDELDITGVVLGVQPGFAVALAGQQVHGSLHVAGRKVVDPRPFRHAGVLGA